MSGYSITGLPNPIDRDAVANKNYVENWGAITKKTLMVVLPQSPI